MNSAYANVVAVWLYGSHARGDEDDASDVDILVVGNASPVPILRDVGVNLHDKSVSISAYSVEEFMRMASYGSLFLQHIRMEAVYLGGVRDEAVRAAIYALGPYRLGSHDVESFRGSVCESIDALEYWDGSATFEASVIATVARHASILGCYVSGTPCFNRVRPIWLFGCISGLAWSDIDRLASAVDYRLAAARGRPLLVLPSAGIVKELAKVTNHLIDALEEKVGAYEDCLPPAA